jgi:threonine dehydrogenase-like Zn-dependent dehydrogenase
MKQLVATAPRTLALLDYEDRPVGDDEILIKIRYASPKHGSEIADFRGLSPFIHENYDPEWKLFLPRREGDKSASVDFGQWNVGNMVVGEITATGKKVSGYKPGEWVCTYGGIRETHIARAVDNHRLLRLPENVPWQSALCYDPAQFALGGIRDGQVRPGDFVAVFGLGAIGQIAVQLAKKSGASIVAAIDPIENRRNIALKQGADLVIDPMKNDVGLELKKCSDKLGMDVIIETSGSKEALQASFRGIGYGGTISYVAWPKEFGAGLNLGREAHYNNAQLVFSRVASEPLPQYPRWNRKRIEATVWQFILDGIIDGTMIIDPIVPFSESAEAYISYVDEHPENSIKLGIRF